MSLTNTVTSWVSQHVDKRIAERLVTSGAADRALVEAGASAANGLGKDAYQGAVEAVAKDLSAEGLGTKVADEIGGGLFKLVTTPLRWLGNAERAAAKEAAAVHLPFPGASSANDLAAHSDTAWKAFATLQDGYMYQPWAKENPGAYDEAVSAIRGILRESKTPDQLERARFMVQKLQGLVELNPSLKISKTLPEDLLKTLS